MPPFVLSDRELATVLDAIIAYADRRRMAGGWGIVPTVRWQHFTVHEPLDLAAIDQLYNRLNTEGDR